jgi:hypothetical protein
MMGNAESLLEMEIYLIREGVIEVWSAILENFMDPVVCIFMCVIDIITLGIILVSWKKLEHRTRRVHLIVFMQTGLRLNIGR